MTEKSTQEKVSSYVILKIVQTAICFVLFALGIAVILLDVIPDDFYIETHIFAWTCLLCGILAGIATVILHNGNKNGDAGTLKCFLCFGCLSYSMFDMCAGGFPLVRTRMEEIKGGPQKAPLATAEQVP